MAMAADDALPPGAAGIAPPALACCIALPRASLIASASARAAVGEVKLNTWVSGVDAPGGCAKTLSITFEVLAGVCCKSVPTVSWL